MMQDHEIELKLRWRLITCEPNSMMSAIHDRTPVILHRADYERWLGDDPDPRDLLVPYPSELMKMWPVGRQVGNIKNQGADILDEVDPDPGTLL